MVRQGEASLIRKGVTAEPKALRPISYLKAKVKELEIISLWIVFCRGKTTKTFHYESAIIMPKHAILAQTSQPGLGPNEWRKGE